MVVKMRVIEKYLTLSKWVRPGKMRKDTKAIVIHWVAKAGQPAMDVIDFWNNRKGSYGSGHAVVDHDGTVFLTLPWDEVGYHVGSSKGYTDLAKRLFGTKAVSPASSPNLFAVGIELCHLNSEGEFSDPCYEAAVRLAAQLCRTYNLKPYQHIVTHQMVVGWKKCPKWMVDHPDEFESFRWDVMAAM